MVGCVLVLLGVLKSGWLADYLSSTVRSAFITASGLIIALSQIKSLMGIKSSSGSNFFETQYNVLAAIDTTNLPTLLIGSLSVLWLLAFKKYKKHIPRWLVRVRV